MASTRKFYTVLMMTLGGASLLTLAGCSQPAPRMETATAPAAAMSTGTMQSQRAMGGRSNMNCTPKNSGMSHGSNMHNMSNECGTDHGSSMDSMSKDSGMGHGSNMNGQ